MCGSQDLSTRRGWSAVCMSWQLGLPATDSNCVCAARCCPCLLEIQKPRRERDLGLRYGYMSVFTFQDTASQISILVHKLSGIDLVMHEAFSQQRDLKKSYL